MRKRRSIGALVALLLLALGCNHPSSRYPTLLAAEEQGAISRGWIPDFLPPSSREIVEAHDLDTNEVWGRFEFAAHDLGPFLDRIRALEVDMVGDERIRAPRGAAWWPPELRDVVFRDSSLRFKRRAVRYHGLLYLLIDEEDGMAFFYGAAQ